MNGAFRKNEPNVQRKEIYDRNGNKLWGTYKKVESDIPDEDIYDKLGNRLDGTYVKVNPDSGLPGIEVYDKNWIKFDGIFRNAEFDNPGEELFDRNGKKSDGTYKKAISDIPNKEVYHGQQFTQRDPFFKEGEKLKLKECVTKILILLGLNLVKPQKNHLKK